MFINNISSSKLNTYRECGLKYKLRYHNRLKPVFNGELNTDALEYGSFVHRVFEIGVEADTLAELNEIAKAEKENYKFAPEKLKNFEKMCNNFLKLNSTLKETVGTESKFKICIDKEFDMNINGIIDRVVRSPSGKILVIDYKTSKRAKTKLELYKDDQMKMYAYAATQLYNVPAKDVVVSHFYPHYDKLVAVSYTATELAIFLQGLKAKLWEIRKKKEPEFVASRNVFCDWCGYKEICPSFNDGVQITHRINEYKEIQKKSKESSDSKG